MFQAPRLINWKSKPFNGVSRAPGEEWQGYITAHITKPEAFIAVRHNVMITLLKFAGSYIPLEFSVKFLFGLFSMDDMKPFRLLVRGFRGWQTLLVLRASAVELLL